MAGKTWIGIFDACEWQANTRINILKPFGKVESYKKMQLTSVQFSGIEIAPGEEGFKAVYRFSSPHKKCD